MKKVCRILPVLAIGLLMVGSAFAQLAPTAPPQIPTVPTADFTTNYFSNNTTAGAPDATLRYTSHYGGVLNQGVGAIELCANVYVFHADQQESACCSCAITPNGLVTTSVKALTGNPLTGIVPANGVIQIVSSLNPGRTSATCDPTFGLGPSGGATFNAPIVAGIDAWSTHIQNKITGPTGNAAFPETETASTEELLTEGELVDLALGCAFVQELGSGQGVCPCGVER